MIEELYIIKGNNRYRLDLNNPSGITLSFKSPLLENIGVFSSSNSYSFDLPFTSTNSTIFEMAEDVRTSPIIGKRYNAEYVIDGICVTKSAFLYIESIEDGYKCVLTWNVVSPLQKISEDDLNINELDEEEEVETGVCRPISPYDGKVSEYDNLNTYGSPYYCAGIADTYFNSSFWWQQYYLYPLPVVPVPYIIKRIEDHYGITLNIYKHLTLSSGTWTDTGDKTPKENTDVIDKGCLPHVVGNVTNAYKSRYLFKMTALSTYYKNVSGVDGESFWFNRVTENGTTYDRTYDTGYVSHYDGHLYSTIMEYDFFGIELSMNTNTEVYGYVGAWFKDSDLLDDDGNVKDIDITFYMSGLTGKKCESIASCSGIVENKYKTIDGNACRHVIFEMRQDKGGSKVSVRPTYASRQVFCGFTYTSQEVDDESFMSFIPDFQDGDIYFYERDIVSSLPSVSCFDFIKSLFYMTGSFPKIEDDGSVSLGKIESLKTNIDEKNVYDWSNIIIDGSCTITSSTPSITSRYNYYLMANESTDEDDEEETVDELREYEDKYQVGKHCIENQSVYGNSKAEIVKLPWYGSFLSNGDNPDIDTGKTIKYWYIEIGNVSDLNDRTKAEEAKPSYGLVSSDTDGIVIMNTWNGLSEDSIDSGIDFLSKMFDKPIDLKAKFLIPFYDLMNIDYEKPVYIEKFNSYFAIINIDLSTETGLSEVELIKIPY